MIRFLTTIVFALALAGCAKPSAQVAPKSVDPLSVESVVLADTVEECRRAILRTGARIVYENSRGILMADRRLSLAQLGGCQGTVEKNEKWDLPQETAGTSGLSALSVEDLLRFLPKEDIKAASFIKNHPESDGRGVKIAVLDTGVELDHPMLRVTSTGQPKMVAAHDFSGEGDVSLESVTVNGTEFTGTDGETYKLTAITGTDYKFGVFKGSSLIYSEDVSKSDKFTDVPVVTYLNAEGERRGRMDLDGDREFGNEAVLYDFDDSRKTFKLGKNRTLTASFNISEDGKKATVVFDDGSHGTHVAGIAAGYDPNGLVGIAPGAQVISAKIGDNRLSGGSTTTASMLLAIDYAVEQGADVINMSYGIRAGSNEGESAIDKYVDKVAWEEDVLFSISAGNEGPGLLTVGTPAGAEYAITNAAYLSSETAKTNYGYINYERDNMWYFSSIGPLWDGGLKPTLSAPGTALSSVPPFAGGHATYSGTSMASPQVTGGLALVLSAAQNLQLPTDRLSITRAIYRGASTIADVMLIQQGYGLMDVEKALSSLQAAKDEPLIQYSVKVLGNSTNSGAGKGIFYRGGEPPSNLFTVQITPKFTKDFPEADKQNLRTYRLKAPASIKVPDTFYLTGTPRTFQVELAPSLFATPGVKSLSIDVTDNEYPELLFKVPVTVIVPHTGMEIPEMTGTVAVGDVARQFIEIPAGVSSLQLDLDSDGPMLWAQLLDPEGRSVLELMDGDRLSPQIPLRGEVNVPRPGIYELDIVAPAYNKRTATYRARVRYSQLKFRKGIESSPDNYTVEIENHGPPRRLKAAVEVAKHQESRWVGLTGKDRVEIPFTVGDQEMADYAGATFRVQTAKSVYDLMTDYPYFVLGPDDELVTAGGLQLDSGFTLNTADLKEGTYRLVVVGAFTETAPASWGFRLTTSWKLKSPKTLNAAGSAQLVQTGQALEVRVDTSEVTAPAGRVPCATVTAKDALGRNLESHDYCE